MANNYNSTLQSNNTDLQSILDTINELPNAGGSDPVLQDKTVTPTTSKQEVTADSNYDGLNKVTVNAMPTATQATPTISINSSTGLITATATQTAGYVAAGTKSVTHQLAFQAAQTITPGTSNKTIAANTYLGGVQTIKGDANLVAANIVSGKSIFGVVGTATTGSGGDTSVEDSLIKGTITNYTNDRVTSIAVCMFYGFSSLSAVNFPKVINIGTSAFYNCKMLTDINFPEATLINPRAFQLCINLSSINFPKVTLIEGYAFLQCSKLISVNLPNATNIGTSAFQSCNLTTASFPKCRNIQAYAFRCCTNLKSLYLVGSTVCALSNSNAFSSTSIGSTKGSIFVQSSLVASYKVATNWTYFSNRIFAYDESSN